MIHIVLVDDHQLVRAAIKSLLAPIEDITVVGEAANGAQGIALVNDKKPDVVLMDLKMKGISGIEATRHILKQHPNIKILALTLYDNEAFSMQLLRMGASAYLTKDCEPDELVRAIRTVYSGKHYVQSIMAQKMALHRFSSDGKMPFDGLSKRESEVALMVARGKRPVEIAKALNLSVKTVNTYRYRLFDKLKIDNNVELMYIALRYGFIESNLSEQDKS